MFKTRARQIIYRSTPLLALLPLGTLFFSSSFFLHPVYYPRPSFSLSLAIVTLIRGDHIAGSSVPSPTTVRALHFLSREDFTPFFPRRLASNCAYPLVGAQKYDSRWPGPPGHPAPTRLCPP